MKPHVFVTNQLPGNSLQRLAQETDMELWAGPGLVPRDILLEKVAKAEGLLCMLTDNIDQALLDVSPHLRVVASCSVGVDHVDLAALNNRAIPLGYTPGVLVETTADLTFALMLAASRRIVEADNFVRDGLWLKERRWEPSMMLGKDIHGATLGIIGLGEIGQAVARRALGFGMKVVSWTRSGRTMDQVESVSIDELLSRADIVSVHVALTSETQNLINARRIAQMKSDAILINTARGGIVDEQALATALQKDELFAAGLDVFANEPIEPNSPLIKLPNVVLLPHIGSASIATRTKMAEVSIDNLLAGLAGEAMPFCRNPL